MTTSRWRAAKLAAWLVVIPPAPSGAEANCPLPLEASFEQLRGQPRYELEGALLPAVVALWPVHPLEALLARPDRATLFLRPDRTLVVALSREGCLVGSFETDLASLLHALRLAVGPAI